MQYNLIQARVVAFLYEAGTIVGLAIIAALASPEFAAVITSHFGDGVTGSLVLLFVSGAVKHIRNLKVVSDAEDLGSASTDGGTIRREPIVLI